jgi:sugar/nucleoside kinase (ribokinase family)
MKKIAVFGSLTQDLYIYTKDNLIISEEYKNKKTKWYALPYGRKLSASYIEKHCGGGAANTSISFKKLGLESIVFGSIGNDETGYWIKQVLEKEGVNHESIVKKENLHSGFSLILNSFEGERTVLFNAESNNDFKDFDLDMLESKKIDALYLCHLSCYSKESIFKKISLYLDENLKCFFAWNPGREQLEEGINIYNHLLKKCDILFLNKEESEKFTGLKSIHYSESKNQDKIPSTAYDSSEIAKKILKTGVKTLVITDGENGAQIFQDEFFIFSPKSLERNKIDTLGAGDAFASAFTTSVLNGYTLKKSSMYASMNSASVISYRGAQDGLLNKEKLFIK